MGHIINITWAAELNSLIEKHVFIAFYQSLSLLILLNWTIMRLFCTKKTVRWNIHNIDKNIAELQYICWSNMRESCVYYYNYIIHTHVYWSNLQPD